MAKKEVAKQDDLLKLVKDQVPKLTKSEAQRVVGVISNSISIRSAPYPSPDEYERYHEIDSDLTNQMKQMVLKEQEHQHTMDEKYLQREYTLRERGQYLAFGVFVLVILLGAYTIYRGFEWGGAVITTIGVGGIITQFLKRR